MKRIFKMGLFFNATLAFCLTTEVFAGPAVSNVKDLSTYSQLIAKQFELANSSATSTGSPAPIETSGLAYSGGVFPSSEATFLNGLVFTPSGDSDIDSPVCPVTTMGTPTQSNPYIERTYTYRLVESSASVHKNLKCIDGLVAEYWNANNNGEGYCAVRTARSMACWK